MTILVMCLLMILLTGCMQMTSNYRIFSDGTYQSEIEILIKRDIYDDSSTNAKAYLEAFLAMFDTSNYQKSESTIEVDGIDYYDLIMKEDRKSSEDASVTITIDDENKEALFVHDLKASDDYLIELDALGLGSNYKEILAMQGFVIIERIQMPGAIKSANVGNINGDILTVDLLTTDINKIIVRSYIDNNVANLFVILFIVITLLICFIALYINFNHKNKNGKPKNDTLKFDLVKEKLKEEKPNDILDTLALEEKEDDRDFPY